MPRSRWASAGPRSSCRCRAVPAASTPRLGRSPSSSGQFVVLQRQDDVGFQAANDVVGALEVAQLDGLHFFEVHVAGQTVGPQILDELGRCHSAATPQAGSQGREDVRVEMGSVAVDLGVVDALRQRTEMGPAEKLVIDRREVLDVKAETALVDGRRRVSGVAEDEPLACFNGIDGQGCQRCVKQTAARIGAAAPDDVVEQAQVVYQDDIVSGQGVQHESLEGFLQGERMARTHGVEEVAHASGRRRRCWRAAHAARLSCPRRYRHSGRKRGHPAGPKTSHKSLLLNGTKGYFHWYESPVRERSWEIVAFRGAKGDEVTN